MPFDFSLTDCIVVLLIVAAVNHLMRLTMSSIKIQPQPNLFLLHGFVYICWTLIAFRMILHVQYNIGRFRCKPKDLDGRFQILSFLCRMSLCATLTESIEQARIPTKITFNLTGFKNKSCTSAN